MYIMPWFLNAPRSTRWTLQCGPITIPTREPALCTSRTVWMEAPHMLSLGWGEETSQLTWFREPHLLDLWLEFAVHRRVSSCDILCSTLSSLWVQYPLAASAYLYCEFAVTPNQTYLESRTIYLILWAVSFNVWFFCLLHRDETPEWIEFVDYYIS